MAKVRFTGERRQTFSTVPPGVLITVEPGKVYETIGGFEYLEKHKDFKAVTPNQNDDPDEPDDAGKPGAGKATGKK